MFSCIVPCIMEAKLQKQIIDFFTLFEEFYNFVKTSLKDCQKCAIAINKINIRSKHIQEANLIGTPLEEFDGLQKKLCTKLYALVGEEIKDIQGHLSKIEEFFEKLIHKQKIFVENCKEIDFDQQTPLVKGTPLQPSLKTLIQYSEDIITFGSQIIAQIETSLRVISFKTSQTPSIEDNFKILTEWQRKAPEIIAYTSFSADNKI